MAGLENYIISISYELFHNHVFYPYAPRAAAGTCHNPGQRVRKITAAIAMLDVHMTQGKRIVMWLIVIALAALVAYFALRGYLSPEMLFGFSSLFSC